MSNLGPQTRLTSPEGFDWARHAKIVKGIDNTHIFDVAPADALLLFRHVTDGQNLDNPHGTVEAILAALGGWRRPGRLVVEPYNEIPSSLTGGLIQALLVAVPLLHQQGILVAGPSWGSGDYGAADFALFRHYGWCGLDFLAVHAYWATKGFTSWNALRWRQWYDPALDPGVVLITECGRDKVRDGDPNVNGGYVGNGGWLLDGLTPETYARELADYAAQLHPNEHATPYAAAPTLDFTYYSTDTVSGLLVPLLGPQETITVPTPHVTNGGNVSTEKDRVYSNLWSRFGATYDPGQAITAKWVALNDAGTYLGAPLGPTQDTEDKTHRFQFFANGVLSVLIPPSGGAWNVVEGMPPFTAG